MARADALSPKRASAPKYGMAAGVLFLKKHRSGIRLRITGFSVLFTLLLSITFASASFFLFRRYARESVLRSAEFNLRLVANLIEQDLVELNGLANRQALDQETVRYLQSDSPTAWQAVSLHSNMAESTNTCRAYSYLQRFIVTDENCQRIVHASNLTNSVPLRTYNIQQLPEIDSTERSVWQFAFHDPLLPNTVPDSLLAVYPVYLPRSEEQIGIVYLTASARLFTDRLSGYLADDAGQIYLRTGEGLWQMESDRFLPATLDIVSSKKDSVATQSPTTLIQNVCTSGRKAYVLVTCPVGNYGISLTHQLPASALFSQDTTLGLFIAGVVFLVSLMGIFLFLYLNRLIVVPVAKLRGRIEHIAAGDFSFDPSIEWPNELGDVGRGVNQLSQDVKELMARRVADEQERQSLEYKMLQNQVNPHFIYNTLNSIKWMATLQGASGIAEMTTAFARLLKRVSKGNRPLHTLREEFALLNDYCTIQQYRYGGAITIEIAEITDEKLCECMIPSFSLQPLAENAIFHGIEPKGGVGSIWLHICQTQTGDVLIAMQDDGVGMSREAIETIFSGKEETQTPYSQIGVRNVHRRIQYSFGPQYGLSIFSEPGEYTRVELRIPYRPSGTQVHAASEEKKEPRHD